MIWVISHCNGLISFVFPETVDQFVKKVQVLFYFITLSEAVRSVSMPSDKTTPLEGQSRASEVH